MAITNGYTTRDIVAAELGITSPSATQQTQIDAAVNAASRQIDAHTGRRFWQDGSLVTREYYADSYEFCPVDDISTVTGLVVKLDDADTGTFDTTLTITTHFILHPVNAGDRVPVWPYTGVRIVDSGYRFPMFSSGRPGVQVTAKFGWPAVPDDVTKACVIQAALLFKAQDATFGAAQLGLDGSTVFIGQLHATARGLLEPYVRRDAM